ncbi:MAG: 50S ribosomal protein L11 methyltransferase [Gemmatimonadaceae bacterium]
MTRDFASAILIQAGAGATVETTDGVTTMLRIRDLRALHASLESLEGTLSVDADLADESAFGKTWIPAVRIQRVGALVIAPPWLVEEIGPADPAICIVIEPAMAFGTGDHETTRGILRLMQQVISEDDLVADLGAGSGILSIAAAKLGARGVAAIEIDPDAIGNLEANVQQNSVSDRVKVLQGDAAVLLPLVAPVHLVLANIVSSVLLQLLPCIRAAITADGRAVLSGMLLAEHAEMCAAMGAEGTGWSIDAEDVEGEWWSATTRPR